MLSIRVYICHGSGRLCVKSDRHVIPRSQIPRASYHKHLWGSRVLALGDSTLVTTLERPYGYLFIVITMASPGRYRISNYRQLKYLFNNFFKRTTPKITSKLRITGPFLEGIRMLPMDSPHKGPAMMTAFPCHDVIMFSNHSISLDGRVPVCMIDRRPVIKSVSALPL